MRENELKDLMVRVSISKRLNELEIMKEDKDILTRAGRRDGMTVPEGFFNDFALKMEASLPERPEVETRQTIMPAKTVWERIRPYVYMAAMFGGIWCMLKMFTMMMPTGVDLSIENNRVITEALSDENFVYDYIVDDLNNHMLLDEMYEDSISVDDMMPIDSLEGLDEMVVDGVDEME